MQSKKDNKSHMFKVGSPSSYTSGSTHPLNVAPFNHICYVHGRVYGRLSAWWGYLYHQVLKKQAPRIESNELNELKLQISS